MDDPTSSRGWHREASSIDNTTKLCSWGANGYGQLGQGHREDQLLPVQLNSDLLQHVKDEVTFIGGGGGFSFILTGTGKILTCGNNDKGQLGRDTETTNGEKVGVACEGGEGVTVPAADSVPATTSLTDSLGKSTSRPESANKVDVFSPCRSLEGVKVVKAAAGWDFILALSDEGAVYSWGSNSFGQLGRQVDETSRRKWSRVPGQVTFLNQIPQRDIAAGLRHGLSVSEDNFVFGWGHGKRGQLGSEVEAGPMTKSIILTPIKVVIPTKGEIKSVFAGMYHSGALTKCGSVFLWGCNAYGQCGIQPETNKRVTSPCEVTIPLQFQEQVTEVCSGWTHLVARTDGGNLFSWGRANLGQLGRRVYLGFDPIPAQVEGLSQVVAHRCGSEHNVALSEAKMYAWGWNEHGICATGDEEEVHFPRRVNPVIDQLERMTGVGCGAGHTFCIVRHQVS